MTAFGGSSGDDDLDSAIRLVGKRIYTVVGALRENADDEDALMRLVTPESLALLMVGLDGPDAIALKRMCVAVGGPDQDVARSGGAILGFLLGLTYCRVAKPLQTVTEAR